MSRPLAILGSGYTGRFLASVLEKERQPFVATSRDPGRHLPFLADHQRLYFDLMDRASWAGLPEQADWLWCFPATPLDVVKRFLASATGRFQRLIVLGSTSAYDTGLSDDYPPPWIDETAPIDRSKPRVQGEEHLRAEYGAIILRVAGIYGPGRNPLEWIKSGRIGPSRKYVNLIHVEDLVTLCLAALRRGTPGEIYNVSDGTPRTWEEICRVVQDRWGMTPPSAGRNEDPGKRIDIRKLRAELEPHFRYPDLYKALSKWR
ncbi:MAG TPA: hypothetical protein VFS39_01200 [Nitrospira sp.]|nr:hypothetical protein [Nitrospira sp.]